MPPHLPEALITKVWIKDYRSIALCGVDLRPLTFLVGPNGSGKSNFLDALRFVSDCLRVTLDQALRDRGGINEVRRRSEGHPSNFRIVLEGQLAAGTLFRYGFEIAARKDGGFTIKQETCQILRGGARKDHFEILGGELQSSSFDHPPPVSDQQLFLLNVAGFPRFFDLWRFLGGMGFYNLNPKQIGDLQAPDRGDRLARDGGNLAAVVAMLRKVQPARYEKVIEYMRAIVPGLEIVRSKALGNKETLEFEELGETAGKKRKFLASSMSDGTLRSLGVLAALFQSPDKADRLPPIAIEEPEMALHPAAAGVLFDALKAASRLRQVLVTSHSPDLLDRSDIPSESIIAVLSRHGKSQVAPIEDGQLKILQEGLRTPGELLRINQLSPAAAKIPRKVELQRRLF